MLRFRPRLSPSAAASPADLLAVSQVIDDAMQPGNFLVAAESTLTWSAARAETIAWEIFRGRLLEPTQTRLQKTFLCWHVAAQEGPLLSVKLDVHTRCIHVTRGLLCHVWEGYDAGGGIIESRETVKWIQELVGTIDLEHYTDLDEVRDELICLLWQAVVGTSRLPLTSVEAPLPGFVFGQLHYLYRTEAGEQAIRTWEEGLLHGLRTPICGRELVKLVEFTLRRVTAGDMPRLAELFRTEWAALGHSLPPLLRSLFNDVSLSPYTRFVENSLAWVKSLAGTPLLRPEEFIDFLSYLLRQLARHLTAYDLVTFHQRGANYPDALLLDAVLKIYLRAIEDQPALFLGKVPGAQLRRRALRQGCLLRRQYEGHFVPDAPTSPGENARVMPAAHPRVPEEQLLQPQRRRRQLFADDPLPHFLSETARSVFKESIPDLEDRHEQIELGVGVFIDRPLGYAKAAAEPDQTPLLAHEAFSPSLAQRRLEQLQRLCLDLGCPWSSPLFQPGNTQDGLAHSALASCPRPVAALADVRRVAADFVILRTLPGGLAAWCKLLDWRPLQKRFRLYCLAERNLRWCVQALDDQQQPVLALFDAAGRRRLEMQVDVSQGYMTRAGVEGPAAGLRVITVWEDMDDPAKLQRHDLAQAPCRVPLVL